LLRAEIPLGTVVSGGDPPPVFQAAKLYLNPVPSFVASLVIFDGLVARLSAGDAGPYSLFYKGLTKLIRAIYPVPQKPEVGW